jgi:hypothetical protein
MPMHPRNAHRKPGLHDPTTLAGWWLSMQDAVRMHRKNQRVQNLYDVLLKLTKTSEAPAGLWKVLQRWDLTSRFCSNASRRDNLFCLSSFTVDTQVITKSCNVSTLYFFEVVLDPDSDKHDELVHRCRSSLPTTATMNDDPSFDLGTEGTFQSPRSPAARCETTQSYMSLMAFWNLLCSHFLGPDEFRGACHLP